MPIDSSMYAMLNKAPDIAGGIEQGMKMRDMLDNRERVKVQDAQNAEAFQMQKQNHSQNQQKFQFEKQERDLQLFSRVLGSANDQASWERGLSELQKNGIPVDDEPRQFDPKYRQQILDRSVPYLDKLKLERERQSMGLREREVSAAEKAAGMKAQREINSGEHLPIDKKKIVTDLASQNAAKTSIRNQINAVMERWDSYTPDQKVDAGRQLVKTLNSTEGKDAVGNDERSVLSSKLKYALGNFTNDNPTQFGRDLDGFKKQSLNVSKSMDGAIKLNQAEIDRNMGRQARPNQPAPSTNQPPVIKGTEIKWKTP